MKIKIRQINDEDSHSSINTALNNRNAATKVTFELQLGEGVQLENHAPLRAHSVTDVVLDDVVLESVTEINTDGSKLVFAKYLDADSLKVFAKALTRK